MEKKTFLSNLGETQPFSNCWKLGWNISSLTCLKVDVWFHNHMDWNYASVTQSAILTWAWWELVTLCSVLQQFRLLRLLMITMDGSHIRAQLQTVVSVGWEEAWAPGKGLQAWLTVVSHFWVASCSFLLPCALRVYRGNSNSLWKLYCYVMVPSKIPGHRGYLRKKPLWI